MYMYCTVCGKHTLPTNMLNSIDEYTYLGAHPIRHHHVCTYCYSNIMARNTIHRQLVEYFYQNSQVLAYLRRLHQIGEQIS